VGILQFEANRRVEPVNRGLRIDDLQNEANWGTVEKYPGL